MEISLDGPVGQVYALVVINDMLFAGTQVIFFFFHWQRIWFSKLFYCVYLFQCEEKKKSVQNGSHGGHPASLSLLAIKYFWGRLIRYL
jgi:hypothetical protein